MFSLKDDVRIHIWVPSCMVWLIKIGGLTCVNALFGDVWLARSWHAQRSSGVSGTFFTCTLGIHLSCSLRVPIHVARIVHSFHGHLAIFVLRCFWILFVKQAQNALAPHIIVFFWSTVLGIIADVVA